MYYILRNKIIKMRNSPDEQSLKWGLISSTEESSCSHWVFAVVQASCLISVILFYVIIPLARKEIVETVWILRPYHTTTLGITDRNMHYQPLSSMPHLCVNVLYTRYSARQLIPCMVTLNLIKSQNAFISFSLFLAFWKWLLLVTLQLS